MAQLVCRHLTFRTRLSHDSLVGELGLSNAIATGGPCLEIKAQVQLAPDCYRPARRLITPLVMVRVSSDSLTLTAEPDRKLGDYQQRSEGGQPYNCSKREVGSLRRGNRRRQEAELPT